MRTVRSHVAVEVFAPVVIRISWFSALRWRARLTMVIDEGVEGVKGKMRLSPQINFPGFKKGHVVFR